MTLHSTGLLLILLEVKRRRTEVLCDYISHSLRSPARRRSKMKSALKARRLTGTTTSNKIPAGATFAYETIAYFPVTMSSELTRERAYFYYIMIDRRTSLPLS